jgi:hypothetical protein
MTRVSKILAKECKRKTRIRLLTRVTMMKMLSMKILMSRIFKVIEIKLKKSEYLNRKRM